MPLLDPASGAAGVRVACVQTAPQFGERRRNLDDLAAAVARASGDGARIVVLPELAATGYAFTDWHEASRLAEPVDGETVGAYADWSARHDLVLVGGFCERGLDGELFNSAAVLDAGRLAAVYRKAHLWDREKVIFTPGDDPPPVVATGLGRVGVLICYDLEFPEWVRLPALAGAELLAVPVNWPAADTTREHQPAEVTKALAAAATNRLWVACCDRGVPERGISWIGGSLVADPDGIAVAGPAPGPEPCTVAASIDLARARDKRVSPRNDVLADRRPALYGALAAPTTDIPGTGQD